MSLRTNEGNLFFPTEHPADIPEDPGLKLFPGTFAAVPYPARTETEGGIMLRSFGSGWSERHPEMIADARRKYRDAEREFREALQLAKRENLNYIDTRLKVQRLFERCRSYAEKIAFLQQDEQPGFGMNTRPDAWSVIASNVPEIKRGDRVMCAPYSGHRWESFRGIADFTIFGREDDWRDVTILIWNPVEELWEPLADWVTIYVQPLVRKVGDEELFTLQNRYHSYGLVAQVGPDATSKPGTTVMLHKDRMIAEPDNTHWFQSAIGPYPANAVWVREPGRVLGEVEIVDAA